MAGGGMNLTHEGGVGPGRRSWASLPPEQQADIIDQNVQQIFRYGQKAGDEIVQAARDNFVRDYSEIESERMRRSVLRDLNDLTPADPAPAEQAEPAPKAPGSSTTLRRKLHSIIAIFLP